MPAIPPPVAAPRTKNSHPPLVFLHGFRGNGTGLRQLEQYFPDYYCHFPDLPPAGGNTLRVYNAALYADFVANYIKEHRLKKPILIGHSMGSLVAAAVAEKYPDLIADHIVLLSPISKKPARFFAAISPYSAILPTRVVDYVTTKYLYVAPEQKNHLQFRLILTLTHACSTDYTSRRDIYRSAQFSSHHSLGDFKFKRRALIVAGEKDRLIPIKHTKQLVDAMNANFPDSTTSVFIKDAGHLINYERPAAVAKAIRSFLKTA